MRRTISEKINNKYKNIKIIKPDMCLKRVMYKSGKK